MGSKPSIIVTGASSGIGAFCARALAKDGYEVFATVRKEEDKISLERDGIAAYLMDYTQPETIHALVDEVLARTGGRLDALFNNGAYGQTGAVEDLSTDTLRAQFEANFFGWHELTRRVIPVMRAQGHGRIVQCSSVLGLMTYRYRGAYSASKFAVEALSIAMRMELEDAGIHVSLIEPGAIQSQFVANALIKFEDNIDRQNSAHRLEYERQLSRLKGQTTPSSGKLGPDAVYKVLHHALTSPRPKPHYIVTRPAKQGVWLKRLLPARLFYRIMSKLG